MEYLILVLAALFIGIAAMYVDTQIRLRRTIKALQSPISERDFSKPCRHIEPEKQPAAAPDLVEEWAQEQASRGVRVDYDTIRQQQAAWRRFEEEG